MQTAFPAKVVSYDADTQTAQLEPQIAEISRDIDSGERVTESLPILPDVPVVFPRGGGFFLSFPLAAGDYVLVVCSKYSIDRWRSTAQAGDPGDTRTFGLSGAIAIPGVYPNSGALDNASGTNLVIGKDSGHRITITSSQTQVGGTSHAAAKASVVDAKISALESAVGPAINAITPGSSALLAAALDAAGATASSVLKMGS